MYLDNQLIPSLITTMQGGMLKGTNQYQQRSLHKPRRHSDVSQNTCTATQLAYPRPSSQKLTS